MQNFRETEFLERYESAILLKASTRTQSCDNLSKFVLRRYCRLIKIELCANYNKKEFISWIVLIAIVS